MYYEELNSKINHNKSKYITEIRSVYYTIVDFTWQSSSSKLSTGYEEGQSKCSVNVNKDASDLSNRWIGSLAAILITTLIAMAIHYFADEAGLSHEASI